MYYSSRLSNGGALTTWARWCQKTWFVFLNNSISATHLAPNSLTCCRAKAMKTHWKAVGWETVQPTVWRTSSVFSLWPSPYCPEYSKSAVYWTLQQADGFSHVWLTLPLPKQQSGNLYLDLRPQILVIIVVTGLEVNSGWLSATPLWSPLYLTGWQ